MVVILPYSDQTMKQTLIAVFLFVQSGILYPQAILNIEGQEIFDTVTGASNGFNIPRSQPTILTFRNNSLKSVNSGGYILQAGDEGPRDTNNNLDGEVITGNKFIWNGTDESSWTHALFTGYNVNVIIKYNYLNNTPNGIQRKSNGMNDIEGIVSYNILKNPRLGIAVKGINGIKIFNNTFYSDKTPSQTWRGLVDICTNTDKGLNAVATGTKVLNNIFYTRNRVFNIKIHEIECLVGFESDYNVFWCEAGEPIFEIAGQSKTFTQWQALGYDLHSVVVNPNFLDLNDFVPGEILNYGKNLGSDFNAGLAIDAEWGKTDPRTVDQNNVWQVGARILEVEDSDEIDLPLNSTLLYPNPANGFFYVLMTDLDMQYQTMKIYDSKGNIIMAHPIEYGLNKINIPEKVASGLYNVALEADNHNRYVKKLIVID